MLPAAGYRYKLDGSLSYRGFDGVYWSSSWNPDGRAWGLSFNSDDAYTNFSLDRMDGFSVRCVVE
jgi:uncharacterized protein (TIGR02145 family)